MKDVVTLVVFNETEKIHWSLGKKISIGYSVNELYLKRKEILKEPASYILFWDANIGVISEEIIGEVTNSKGDLWHIGAVMGLSKLPYLLDCIQPTNMLNITSSIDLDHSSWKHTFRGSLMKFKVFESTPLLRYTESLDLIGMDFGFKAMKSGVLTRFSHILSSGKSEGVQLLCKKKDELLFIRHNFDTKAFIWCYLLSIFSIAPRHFLRALKQEKRVNPIQFKHNLLDLPNVKKEHLSVSIVIATLERYPFLQQELKELRELSVPVKEIIIVDQTPGKNKNKEFLAPFQDLPIVYLETDTIGQCSARNLGIEKATGEFIWFLDDDMEDIPANYLEKHLKTLVSLDADISCGIPDEIGTNFIDRSIPKIELSEGFPTNDVLVKKQLLVEVGGFDEKMDQKQSEDQEIGLRLVKRGALSVKNNQLRIVHLRASRGGLRKHNVRKITFSSARNSLFQRRFLHHSEIYISLKHFSKKQTQKAILLNLRGTFIIRGGVFKKMAKIFFATLFLPHTLLLTFNRLKMAKKMLNE